MAGTSLSEGPFQLSALTSLICPTFGRGFDCHRPLQTSRQAIASGMAFFHLPCAFRISSTTSRIAPLPPSTVVM